ncbi:hypothetical protein UMZ34_04925 [Halopseudomonas pachastrellae]|nr:hypothetical protein UMZ34_04925 [Halopseudomonas pachastrellae]
MPSEHYWLSPAVHPIYAAWCWPKLRRQGYQDNPALSVLGQNWEQQLQGNQFLNLETLCHLLQAVILRTGHPAWALLPACIPMYPPTALAATPPSPRPPLAKPLSWHNTTRRCASTWQPSSSNNVTRPCCAWTKHLVPLAVRDYLLGHFTTGMLRLLETVSGQPLGPELTLEWPGAKPDWADAVRDYAANWVFDGDALRLHLPAACWSSPAWAPTPSCTATRCVTASTSYSVSKAAAT